MTDQSLEAIKARAAEAKAKAGAATEEPWTAYSDGVIENVDSLIGSAESTVDAEFIAAARSLVPQLADDIETLLAENEHWRKQCWEAVQSDVVVCRERDQLREQLREAEAERDKFANESYENNWMCSKLMAERNAYRAALEEALELLSVDEATRIATSHGITGEKEA